jgi:hypothetical protein
MVSMRRNSATAFFNSTARSPVPLHEGPATILSAGALLGDDSACGACALSIAAFSVTACAAIQADAGDVMPLAAARMKHPPAMAPA